jgi:hypothetical protein
LPKTYIRIEIIFIKSTNGINKKEKEIEIQTTNSDYLLLMMLKVKVKWRRQQKTKATHFLAGWQYFPAR